MDKIYNIAIVATAPFYYHTPLYRKLSTSKEVNLTVYYCSDETLHGTDVARAYGIQDQKIADSQDLLGGYNHVFLKNSSPFPSIASWPFGLMNFGIWREIKKGKYDAVILTAWTDVTRGLAFLSAFTSKTPILFMTDNNVLSESLNSLPKRVVKRTVLEFLFKKATGFLAAGQANVQLYTYFKADPKKITRMPFSWGYEQLLKEGEELAPKREQIRQSFGVAKQDFVMLYVGRLSREKSPFALLEAYQKVDRRNKKLFIVGDGPLRKKLEEKIKKQNIQNVYLIGFLPRKEIFKFYSMADVFVMPSKRDALPLAVNEAMCFGLPVISSNKVGTIVDLIRDGYDGFVFPAGDMDAFVNCMTRLIDMPKAKLKALGRHAKEMFSQSVLHADPVKQITGFLQNPAVPITKKYNIAIIGIVPFYYHIPLYKELYRRPDIESVVYYCSDQTLRGEDLQKNYNTKNTFASKSYLLEGYEYKLMKNYSLRPSYFLAPFGLVNFGVWNVIRKHKHDAVILQAWNNATWWLAFLAGLIYKTPVFFMTDENLLDEGGKSSLKRFIKKISFKYFLFPGASGFLTSGSANEDFYKSFGVPESKIARMYFSYGYQEVLEKAKQILPKRSQLRVSLGIKDTDFVALYVGRMAKEKNLFTLLDAYHKADVPNKKLFLVGDGPLSADIKQYVIEKNIPGVSMQGFKNRDAALHFYAAADVLILPSISEPWGMVINEAMCFGLPIIASDRVGAVPELVKENVNGFVFNAQNSDELSLAIQNVAALPKDKKQLFKENSLSLINEWVTAVNPGDQIIKLIEGNKKEKINFLKKLSYNPALIKVIRFLHLKKLLRKYYYFFMKPKDNVLHIVINGIESKFYVRDPDELRLTESVSGSWGEQPILKRLIKSLNQGDVVYDVGANIGVYAIILAKAVGETGKVVAFEPEEHSQQGLQENIALNKLQHILPVKKALGQEKSTAKLYIGKIAGNISLIDLHEKDGKHETIEIVRADDYAKEQHLPLPNLVKIDVEGYEFSVLLGMKDILSNPACKVLCIEMHPYLFVPPVTEEKIFDTIKSFGFSKIDMFRSSVSTYPYHIIAYKS